MGEENEAKAAVAEVGDTKKAKKPKADRLEKKIVRPAHTRCTRDKQPIPRIKKAALQRIHWEKKSQAAPRREKRIRLKLLNAPSRQTISVYPSSPATAPV